ncbi:glycerol kinase GlpK [Desulfobaculum bizertense]|uniref:Glycerol kinase n=1 Tax=Desulfobaculum bizertense DSM 18034 TaxID=1121442 RepID=A0A1T4VHD6_9BACT|nr:glycerol kinase GlpK [Desulfobaculum bizertense]UIJ37837.1 glycerol kinase GlpK [Desulfobaculum bizertense]SKA64323.1 glycerol kinase [Desulfobaculum bizertense DSM 18034]
MAEYIGAVDQGTTSTRFIIFDKNGRIVGLDQKEHEQIYPEPGWVEHDPLEIWANTQEVIRGALLKSGIKGSQLAAIGITNQRETTVVWDRLTGKPYYNAIVWQCTRTHEICKELMENGGQDRFREVTGLPVATYFSGPKIKWILENVPEARAAAERGDALFGTMETWVIWWLTGGPKGGAHVTDVTNASRTMLMDLKKLEWDEDIMKIMGVPRQMLPRIVPSSDAATWGSTDEHGPLQARVPVCGAVGDQQAALVGQTCFTPGEAKNTYGTGCFLLLHTGHEPIPSRHGLITTVAYQFSGRQPSYCLEGSIAIAGALVQWLRDNMGMFEDAAEVEELAKQVENTGGVYVVPAFSGLFAPYWRPDARGVIAGLTRYVNKHHIARAVLEATAYQTRDIVEAMNRDSGVPLTSLKVDGGMVRNELLMQFQSDVLNVPVTRPSVAETTCLGAAYAAGIASGFWNERSELIENWQEDRTWSPRMEEETREQGYRGWKKAVDRTLNWVE